MNTQNTDSINEGAARPEKWAHFSERVRAVLASALGVLSRQFPGHTFYSVGLDCSSNGGFVFVAGSTVEHLVATALKKFPDRPVEIAHRVLRWDFDEWLVCDLESYCKSIGGISFDWPSVPDDFDGTPDAQDLLHFRLAILRAALAAEDSEEFRRLPKTEDFSWLYIENEDPMFRTRKEIEAEVAKGGTRPESHSQVGPGEAHVG